MIKEGGVKLDGDKVSATHARITVDEFARVKRKNRPLPEGEGRFCFVMPKDSRPQQG